MSASAAAKLLSHEHVHERAQVVAKLLEPASDINAVLRASHACVVTKAEHKALSVKSSAAGWMRYVAAGVHPIDLATGQPMDLQGAIDGEAYVWGPTTQT